MTGIQWTDATWNPLRGCSRVSAGCVNCYAEKVAARFHAEGQPYHGLTVEHGGKRRWNGEIAQLPEKLTDPLRWTKPRMVFVNSMSDLFHERVPFPFIDKVFAVMALAPHHTFQVLTKRPARMLKYLTTPLEPNAEPLPYHLTAAGLRPASRAGIAIQSALCGLFSIAPAHALLRASDWQEEHAPGGEGFIRRWPLPNVWLGVSVEDQATADERIPLLLQTPAAVRFVSYEPALGHVDFRDPLNDMGEPRFSYLERVDGEGPRVDWLIAGGESGPGARPCNIDWIRSAVQQCHRAGVAVFVKQLGAEIYGRTGDGPMVYRFKDRKGGDPSEWPEDLRVREWPKTATPEAA